MNNSTYELFKAIEVRTRHLLPLHLAGSAQATCSNKEELVQSIVSDETVQQKWRPVGAVIVDDDDSNGHWMVDMWITMRGFAITSKWMEDYKRAKNKSKHRAYNKI